MDMTAPRPDRPDQKYDHTALVLQGGGALGSYQAGVYESLAEAGVYPDWFAGISIGSINAAILAGNTPERRLDQLRSFWHAVTSQPLLAGLLPKNTASRRMAGKLSSMNAMVAGIGGFFSPRFPPAWMLPDGDAGALSFYDTTPLRQTLLDHVDFDLINSGAVRLSLGAVNVRTGNFAYFDNSRLEIRPEHVMASGALPPGFPPIQVDGEYYWDGGLVSNTPLSYVLESARTGKILVLQVDLFSARGPFPQNIDDVEERRKDIGFSSRTRMNTDSYRERHQLKQAINQLVAALPKNKRDDPEFAALAELGTDNAFSIVHFIYRRAAYDGSSKDFEFSRRTMTAHWAAGRADARRTVRRLEWREPPLDTEGIAVFDMTRSGVN